jgi:hypothetical protein
VARLTASYVAPRRGNCEGPSSVPRDGSDRIASWVVFIEIETLGEDLRGEAIASGGQGQLDCSALRPAVELCRTSCTGPASAAAPAVFDLEEAGGHKAVQVERGQRSPDSNSGGGCVAIDGIVSTDDMVVERATHGLTEDTRSRDRVERDWGGVIDLFVVHGSPLYRMCPLVKDLTALAVRAKTSTY